MLPHPLYPFSGFLYFLLLCVLALHSLLFITHLFSFFYYSPRQCPSERSGALHTSALRPSSEPCQQRENCTDVLVPSPSPRKFTSLFGGSPTPLPSGMWTTSWGSGGRDSLSSGQWGAFGRTACLRAAVAYARTDTK
ncbi:hypothetical protein BU26DRAFT_518682 [Trematosphaeria pertusa]|uniref:Uncharacterized protein n=1 Tax=Trematosphaeria pertusa TaxID=390896 RepID=A0A6A6IIR6_9PLEO|nr:uncharacterized protein BU26DRAFT_518682 [Trematosphaeria pertusa]KAF2250266.1 hypothetical protein BU26DRAFT_518682 [Trematosphaeria pertusa]